MGAFENQLHENETKESLIELYSQALQRINILEDQNKELKHQTQRLINYLNPLLEIAKCSVK